MKNRRLFFCIFVATALPLQACGGSDATIQTAIAQTAQISELQTAAASGSQGGQEQQAGVTEEPFTTVEVTTVRDLNMRSGDGTAYNVMTVIPANESVLVSGVNAAGTWYQIEYHDVVGWISAQYTEGDVPADMPIATAPSLAGNGGGGGNDGGGGGNDNGGGGGGDECSNGDTWEGDWNMFIGVESVGVVSVCFTGNHAEGAYSHAGYDFVFTGNMNADGNTIRGTFTNTTLSVSSLFYWYLQNPDVFTGKYEESDGNFYAWCGWKDGSTMPNPCQAP